MKRIVCAPTFVLLCLAFAFQTVTSAVDSGPSANGDFQFTLDDGITRYIQFDGRLHGEEGRGSMTFADPSSVPPGEGEAPTAPGVQMAVNFDCMKVEGSRAVMGGVISSSNIQSAINKRVLLVVEDNGEGVNAAEPDRLTWGIYSSSAPGWTPVDAERDDDIGATLTWLATDFERLDDVGIRSNRSPIVGCGSFPLSSYSFVNVGHGNGNIQVRR